MKTLYDYLAGCLMGIALGSPLLFGSAYASHTQAIDRLAATVEHVEARLK